MQQIYMNQLDSGRDSIHCRCYLENTGYGMRYRLLELTVHLPPWDYTAAILEVTKTHHHWYCENVSQKGSCKDRRKVSEISDRSFHRAWKLRKDGQNLLAVDSSPSSPYKRMTLIQTELGIYHLKNTATAKELTFSQKSAAGVSLIVFGLQKLTMQYHQSLKREQEIMLHYNSCRFCVHTTKPWESGICASTIQ